MIKAVALYYLRQLFSPANPLNYWALALLSSLFVAELGFAQLQLTASQLHTIYWVIFFISLQGLGFGALRHALTHSQDMWLSSFSNARAIQTVAKIIALSTYVCGIIIVFHSIRFLSYRGSIIYEALMIVYFTPLLSLYVTCYLVTFESIFPERHGLTGHLLVPFLVAPLIVIMGIDVGAPLISSTYVSMLLMLGMTLFAAAMPTLSLVLSTRSVSFR